MHFHFDFERPNSVIVAVSVDLESFGFIGKLIVNENSIWGW